MLKFFVLRGCDVDTVDAPNLCSFGIGEALAAAGAWIGGGIATGATALGIGAETAGVVGSTLGDAIVGASVGGAVGSGEAALSGGSILKGFESGAVQGAVTYGLGGLLETSSVAGLTPSLAQGISGAAGGALGNAVVGRDPASGALIGGAEGAALGALSPSNTTPTAATPGGVTSAAASAAPGSVPAPTPDVTGPDVLQGDLTSTPLPGSVGSGAASGTPSNVSGVNTAPATPQVSPLQMSPLAAAPTASSALAPAAAATLPPAAGATPSAASGAPAAGGGETSFAKFLDNPSFSSGLDVLKENPMQALNVATLGYGLMKGQQNPPGYGQIQGEASQLAKQSGQLESYLSSGQLPPGIQNSINAAGEAAAASIRSRYAAQGMSGSSAESQDLANVQTAMAGQAANIAMQLYQQGVAESQVSTQLYEVLMQTAMQQDAELANAVGNFAFAMAGGSRPITAQTGG